jgi:DNA-directed RNA polymerase subunit RPC12/RpoP
MTSDWIKKDRAGWLRDYVKPKPGSVAPPVPQGEGSEQIQVFTPIICPKCGSRSVRSYGADKPVLYYSCQKCRHKFKVIEKDSAILTTIQSEQKKALVEFKDKYSKNV